MIEKEFPRKHAGNLSHPARRTPAHTRMRSGKAGFFSGMLSPLLILCLLLAGCTSSQQRPYDREHNRAHDHFRSFRTEVADRSVKDPSAIGDPGPSAGRAAPVQGGYVVKKGDTLYSIAQGHGVDPKVLAEWNNIADPRAIYVGQQLFMAPPQLAEPSLFSIPDAAPSSSVVSRPDMPPPPETKQRAGPAKLKTEPQALKLPYSDQAVAQLKSGTATPPAMAIKADPILEKDPATAIESAPPSPNVAPGDDRIEWIWPARGKIAELFSESTKGIDIAGKPGQTVTASAGGKVVYSGEGLRGYGKLIIIKHNNTYLSAYAHNSKLLVKEGQTVTRGQKIAEMGDTDSTMVKLHFEIRKNGKPVDPLKHLPGLSG